MGHGSRAAWGLVMRHGRAWAVAGAALAALGWGARPAGAEVLGYYEPVRGGVTFASAGTAAYLVRFDLPDPGTTYEVLRLGVYSEGKPEFTVFPAGTEVVVRVFSAACVPVYTSGVFDLSGTPCAAAWREFDVAAAHLRVTGLFYGGIEQRGTDYTFGFCHDSPLEGQYGRSLRYVNASGKWYPGNQDYMFAAHVAVPGASAVWTGAAGGTWSLGGNWSGGQAPGAAATAVFDAAAPAQPVLDQDASVAGVEFRTGGWTVGGADRTLTLGAGGLGAAGAGTVCLLARAALAADSTWTLAGGAEVRLDGRLATAGRTLIKDGAGTLIVSGPQSHAAGSALDVRGGTVWLNTSAGTPAGGSLALTVSGSAAHFGAGQRLASLALDTGTSRLAGGGDMVLVTRALAIDASDSVLDLADNRLVVDYAAGAPSPLPAVAAWLRSGANLAAGCWDGLGIASSAARDDPALLTALGVLDNADPWLGGRTDFDGEPIDTSSVLVKYTYWGDANLDGAVTFDDYDVIDYYYWFPPPAADAGWWTGDFDYDGDTDFDDYDRIDYAYWFQGGPLGGAAGRAEHAPLGAPEPATLALLAVGGALAAGRRGRRGA